MKNSIIIKPPIYILAILINLFSVCPAQEWQTIIVENNDSSYTHLRASAINSNAKNKIDLLYGLVTDSTNAVYFRSSTDGGMSFTDRKLIEEVATPYGSALQVGSVQYDQSGNLMIIYQHGEYPEWYQRIRKSYDEGVTFGASLLDYNSDAYFYSSFIWDINRTGIFFTHDGRIRPIILRSYDQCLSFTMSDTIPRDLYRTFLYPISIVEAGSDHYIVYWYGDDNSEYRVKFLCNHITQNFTEISSPTIVDTTLKIVNTHAVASYENYVFILYFAREKGTDDNRKMYFRKSEDFGYTYSAPQVLYDYGKNINVAIIPAIKFHPRYGICIALDQYRNGLYFIRSRDFGASFDAKTKIADGIQYINYNSVTINDSGELYVTSVDESTKNVLIHRTNLITAIPPKTTSVIKHFGLVKTYPNPFNSSIKIQYSINTKSQVKINIYNILGEKIVTLTDRAHIPGLFELAWHGQDEKGDWVTSGIYIVQICTNYRGDYKKIFLLK